MIEDPVSRLLALLAGPVVHPAIRLRNSQSLKRLKALAERTTPWPARPVPERRKGPTSIDAAV
jgi:hypothetical protein